MSIYETSLFHPNQAYEISGCFTFILSLSMKQDNVSSYGGEMSTQLETKLMKQIRKQIRQLQKMMKIMIIVGLLIIVLLIKNEVMEC